MAVDASTSNKTSLPWTTLRHLHPPRWSPIQQQQDWLRGWAVWNQERASIKGANTVSKLVEQEFNLMAQIGQLLLNQTTNLVALQENVEVAYAYWLNEKLGPLSSSVKRG